MIMKRRKRVGGRFLWIVLLVLSVGLFFENNVKAGEFLDINYEVTRRTSEARKMLSLINDLRTQGSWYWNSDDVMKTIIAPGELGELKLDPLLEEIAMKRAEEISIYYSHTRPNGKSCFSLFSGVSGMRGENIAAWQTDFNEAFIAWREEEQDYSGQGHRRNMLDSGFTAIGIGCVERNGRKYWTQALGNATGGMLLPADDGVRNVSAQVKWDFISEEGLTYVEEGSGSLTTEEGNKINLSLGETGKLGNMYPYVKIQDRFIGSTIIKKESPAKMTVLNPEIVSLSSDGVLTALKAGNARIQVEGVLPSGKTAEEYIEVLVKNIDLEDYDNRVRIKLPSRSYDYTGSPIEPEPVVQWKGGELQKDKDYRIRYENNIEVGEGKIIIEGISPYVGRRESHFVISERDASAFKPIGIVDKKYTGKRIYQDFKIIGMNGKELVEDRDYTVEYEDNIEVGEARIRLDFIGNYDGMSLHYFNILEDEEKKIEEKKKTEEENKIKEKKRLEDERSGEKNVATGFERFEEEKKKEGQDELEKKSFLKKEKKKKVKKGDYKISIKLFEKKAKGRFTVIIHSGRDKVVSFQYAPNKKMKKAKIIKVSGKKYEIKNLKMSKTYYYRIGLLKGEKIKWTKVKKLG